MAKRKKTVNEGATLTKKKAKAIYMLTVALYEQPLVAYRTFHHKSVKYEIGDPIPEGWGEDHPQFRSFAPANIAGNAIARRQYFLRLDGKIK